MPQPIEILDGLTKIANQFLSIGIVWHLFFAALIVFVLSVKNISNKTVSTYLSLPLLSVSILAWISGNPFNGTTFAVFGILLLFFGIKNTSENIVFAALPYKIIGALVIIYGLVYPHFISVNSVYEYIYSAPTGLVPCPTLSTVLGFAIISGGFGSKKWSVVLLTAGFFYGLFGMFRLGVWLDSGLLIADIVLLMQVINMKKK